MHFVTELYKPEITMGNREIDKQIAEKVFGLEICNNPDHGLLNVMPGDIGRIGCPGCSDNNGDIDKIPKYSTNISDAWEAVKKIADGRYFKISVYPNGTKVETVTDYYTTGKNKIIRVQEISTPLAICLAALKAVDIR